MAMVWRNSARTPPFSARPKAAKIQPSKAKPARAPLAQRQTANSSRSPLQQIQMMFGGILQHFLSEPLKGGQIAVAKIFVDLGTGEGSQQGGGPAENADKGWREETAPEEL